MLQDDIIPKLQTLILSLPWQCFPLLTVFHWLYYKWTWLV